MTAAKTTADAATAPTPLIKTKVDFLPDEVQTLPLDQQLLYYWKSAWQWIDTHTLSIIIAAVIGTLIYLGLNAAKSFGSRYADKHEDQASLTYIALKVIARTSQFFILMVPLKLLSRFAGTPQTIDTIINFLFTVAAVFQVAIWAREIMLRLIRRRTQTSGHFQGQQGQLGKEIDGSHPVGGLKRRESRIAGKKGIQFGQGNASSLPEQSMQPRCRPGDIQLHQGHPGIGSNPATYRRQMHHIHQRQAPETSRQVR